MPFFIFRHSAEIPTLSPVCGCRVLSVLAFYGVRNLSRQVVSNTVCLCAPSDAMKSPAGKHDQDRAVGSQVKQSISRGAQTVVAKSISFMKLVQEKLSQFNRLKLKDVQRVAKETRKSLGLKKSPKRKGYDKFLTDEERR